MVSAFDDNMQALERDNGREHCSESGKAEGGDVQGSEDDLENDTCDVSKEVSNALG
jgi:hypothetical protein